MVRRARRAEAVAAEAACRCRLAVRPARIINERRALERLHAILPARIGARCPRERRRAIPLRHEPRGGRRTQLEGGAPRRPDRSRRGSARRRVARERCTPISGDGFEDQNSARTGPRRSVSSDRSRREPGRRGRRGAEVERLLATRQALVLGDWSPKNLLVYPDNVLALDFEVAHCGDPAFDVAFLLSHLVMKSVHLPQHRAAVAASSRRIPRRLRRRPTGRPRSRPSSVACCSRASTGSRPRST